jgi:hypothetical protein
MAFLIRFLQRLLGHAAFRDLPALPVQRRSQAAQGDLERQKRQQDRQ